VRHFPVPRQPEAITVTGDGAEVWVGSNAEGFVSRVRTATGAVERVGTGFRFPYRILLTDRLALIPDYQAERLRVFDRATLAEGPALELQGLGPQGITLANGGRTAWLSLSNAGQVAEIDIATMRIVRRLDAGARPDGIAWSPVATGR